MRIPKSHPLLKVVNSHLIDSPQSSKSSYLWNFGSLLSLCLGIQIITGLILGMHYTPSVLEAFNSLEHIITDVNNGWLIRYLHSNTASAFFYIGIWWILSEKHLELSITVIIKCVIGFIVLFLLSSLVFDWSGTLLYDIHQWIKEALASVKSVKGTGFNPMGGQWSSAIIGSTDQEFHDLRAFYDKALMDFNLQKIIMRNLIEEQARLEQAILEDIYHNQVHMERLYHIEVNARHAKSVMDNDISNACAELDVKKAAYDKAGQSLADYLRRKS